MRSFSSPCFEAGAREGKTENEIEPLSVIQLAIHSSDRQELVNSNGFTLCVGWPTQLTFHGMLFA